MSGDIRASTVAGRVRIKIQIYWKANSERNRRKLNCIKGDCHRQQEMTTMKFWTGFIRWATGPGRSHSLPAVKKAGKTWPPPVIGSNSYADLDARIDNAVEYLEQLDRQLSEIALVLVEMIEDPKAASARERWKELTAALATLTTTSGELLE